MAGMFGVLTDKYNTSIPANRIAEYQAWVNSLPQQLRGTNDYDLQGAFLGMAQQSGNAHLPDTWKKPSHMTFSSGSIYSTPENMGGNWVRGDKGWVFYASPANLNYNSAKDLNDYFKANEKDSTLVLPIDWSLRR